MTDDDFREELRIGSEVVPSGEQFLYFPPLVPAFREAEQVDAPIRDDFRQGRSCICGIDPDGCHRIVEPGFFWGKITPVQNIHRHHHFLDRVKTVERSDTAIREAVKASSRHFDDDVGIAASAGSRNTAEEIRREKSLRPRELPKLFRVPDGRGIVDGKPDPMA